MPQPPPNDDLQPAFAKLKAAAADLPKVEESTWYGTPALKVGGKGFARVKDADTVVLMASLEDKELLFAAAPDIFYETNHYKGWPAMLVRIHAISEAELKHRLAIAWRLKAPKKMTGGRGT